MRIHLVRHGETRHNAEGRIQGDLLDDDLNGVGRAQAEALGAHYARERGRGLRIAAVYTSPLARARSTARCVAAALGLAEPSVLHGLREVSWGHHMGKLNAGATRLDMTRILNAWEHGDLSACALGGETPGDAWARAAKEVAQITERHEREEVVVVAHGRLNKILVSGLLHGHLHHMERYPQPNTGITLLEGPAPWRIAAPSTTSHLANVRALEERVS